MKQNSYHRLQQLLIAFLLTMSGFTSFAAIKDDYFRARPGIGGKVFIRSMQTSCSAQTAQTTFGITVPTEGDYYLHFWAIIPKTKSGVFTKYKVMVNGVLLNETIKANSTEWHYAPLSGSGKVHFKQGANSVKIIGTPTNQPNVELIYASTNGVIPANSYNILKKNILLQNPTFLDPVNANSSTTEKVRDKELSFNEYQYYTGTAVYTFKTQVYLTKGQTLSIKSKSQGKKPHVLEVFGGNYKDSSWAVSSNGGEELTFSQVAPRNGIYNIRLRMFNQDDLSYGKLTINDTIVYEKIPMSNSSIISSILPDEEFNTFTTNSSGDPAIYFEETGPLPGKIIAYNDDYGCPTGSTYNWKNEARIKRQLSNEAEVVHITSAFSHDPYTTYELYVGCKSSTLHQTYENANAFDLIESSRININSKYGYNCFAWSGGITSEWIYPFESGSVYRKDTELESFDYYYSTRGLTREGATAENSVVDLYVAGTAKDEYICHASVRNGADSNTHGYDWESKLGDWVRVFHPRYAFVGGPYCGHDSIGYGRVKYHYIRKPDAQLRTLEEEIADGTSAIEYVEFSTEDKTYIQNKIDAISSDVLQEFNCLYADWERICNNTYHSNLNIIADCNSYRRVLEYVQTHQELRYVLMQKLADGGFAAIRPFEDVFIPQNAEILTTINSAYHNRANGSSVKLYRPILSNLRDLAKMVIATESSTIAKDSKSKKISDAELSNSLNFTIANVSNNRIDIAFSLEQESDVVIQIKDLAGNICYTRAKGICEHGDYTESIPFNSKGTFLVCLMVDNKLNVKKIIL